MGLLLRRSLIRISIQVASAPGPSAGSWFDVGGNFSFEAGDAPDQLAGGALRLADFAFQIAPAVGADGRAFRLALEAAQQLAHLRLDRLDLVLEARERPLDLLDRAILGHHPLDLVNAADDVRRVEAARAAVLPVARDANRAGQQAELHVLAQRRLREADPARLEHVDDLPRRHSVRPRPLDLVDLAVRQ